GKQGFDNPSHLILGIITGAMALSSGPSRTRPKSQWPRGRVQAACSAGADARKRGGLKAASRLRNTDSSQEAQPRPIVGERPEFLGKEVQGVLRWRRIADRSRDYCART